MRLGQLRRSAHAEIRRRNRSRASLVGNTGTQEEQNSRSCRQGTSVLTSASGSWCFTSLPSAGLRISATPASLITSVGHSLRDLTMTEDTTASTGTLAHYSERAFEFREGTRDHDVTQNIEALLRHIRGAAALPDPGFRMWSGPGSRGVSCAGPRARWSRGRVRPLRSWRGRTAAAKCGNRISSHSRSRSALRWRLCQCIPVPRPVRAASPGAARAARDAETGAVCSSPRTRGGTTRKGGIAAGTGSITISPPGSRSCTLPLS